ncbi:MAG: septum formation inhibitor Maf [Xanthomonadales bacterium]|nr:septum formation inhibitor Maf [Xanthomonadales bacterium]
MKQAKTLLLASGSPRRAELLNQVGIRYRVIVTDVDEQRRPGEEPADYVCRLAAEKAAAGLAMSAEPMPSLGADTVVLLDDQVLGKPRDLAESAAMLERLSGRSHQVLSAVGLVVPDGARRVDLNVTTVTFAPMPDAFIRWYCAQVETLDKAGAYAIQGPAGQFVRRIEGSYSGVMGLPLFETCALLRALGVLS